jgi:hypothetical protein
MQSMLITSDFVQLSTPKVTLIRPTLDFWVRLCENDPTPKILVPCGFSLAVNLCQLTKYVAF